MIKFTRQDANDIIGVVHMVPEWKDCFTGVRICDREDVRRVETLANEIDAFVRGVGWMSVGHLLMLTTEKGVYQIRQGMDGVWDAFILVPHDTEIVWVASRNCLESLQEACEKDSRGEKI